MPAHTAITPNLPAPETPGASHVVFTEENVPWETTRYYRVFALSDAGESPASSVVSGTTPVAGTPTAQDDSAATEADTPVVIDVLANDRDGDGGTAALAIVDESTTDAAGNGSVGLNTGGARATVTYTPNAGLPRARTASPTRSRTRGRTSRPRPPSR